MPELVAVLRIAQLILGSCFGMLCIYLGYRLFAQIPMRITNDGGFKMPSLGEVKLKVAPGIFFALFGSVIIYFSFGTISINAVADGGKQPISLQSNDQPPSPLRLDSQVKRFEYRGILFDYSRHPWP